jgi:FeS assembly SUF system regulator
MIKLSKMTDYAVVILADMALRQGERHTAVGISARIGLPVPTVAKVLKLLVKGKVVISTRGIKGGYTLKDTPERISVARVLTALEGPIELTACVQGSKECCEYRKSCPIKGKWTPVNVAMRQALEGVTLAQMIARG